PATGTIGFGIWSVSGRIRTPRPAARTMALVGVTDIFENLLERYFSVAADTPRPAMSGESYHGDSGAAPAVHAIAAGHDGCATGAGRAFRLPPPRACRPFSSCRPA